MLPDQRPLRREKMICSILLLLSLTSCVSAGTFVVNVTQRFNQAEEKQNITLEWTFTTKPEASLNSLNISCQLVTFLRTLVLFHLHEGVEVSESQDEQFAGRVQFDKDVLREGRLRLHVSRLRINDDHVDSTSLQRETHQQEVDHNQRVEEGCSSTVDWD